MWAVAHINRNQCWTSGQKGPMTLRFWELQKTPTHTCSVATHFIFCLFNPDVITLTKILNYFPTTFFMRNHSFSGLLNSPMLFLLKEKKKAHPLLFLCCSLDFLVQETDVNWEVSGIRELWHAIFPLSSLFEDINFQILC